MESPILVYSDLNELCTLFTDLFKYANIHSINPRIYTTSIDSQMVNNQFPLAYVIGLFQYSQLHWAVFIKEVYTIYMLVKKLSFYLADAFITLRSDNLPLKKFLQKKILNEKINNLCVELSIYNIKFKFIKGVKNMLADTQSRLVDRNLTESNLSEVEAMNTDTPYLNHCQT